MNKRFHLFSWLLVLALALTAAENGLADKKDKKKKKKKEKESAEETAQPSDKDKKEAPSPAQSAPKVVNDVDKRLLAYDTAGARGLLAGEALDSNPHLQLADGRVLEQEGEYSRATARLSEAASALAADPAPLVYLGEVHLRAKSTGAANDAFTRAEQRARAILGGSPNDARALYFLGVAQQRLKRFNEAVATLEQARSASPRDALVVYQLGATHAFQRNWQAAIDLLTQAIDLNPGLAYAYYYRGLSAGEVGRKDLLINDLERFVAMAPNAPEAAQAKLFLSGL